MLAGRAVGCWMALRLQSLSMHLHVALLSSFIYIYMIYIYIYIYIYICRARSDLACGARSGLLDGIKTSVAIDAFTCGPARVAGL